jgi:hypothetical protein
MGPRALSKETVMARKPGLTQQQHVQLGGELAALRDEVQTRFVTVANAYPKTAKQTLELRKALSALDAARCALDNALAREDWDGFEPRVYYPGDDRPTIAYRPATRRRQ